MFRADDLDKYDKYHQAAKLIEIDGVGAYHTVTKQFGEEVANHLLVAFLRRNLGDQYPSKEDIVEKTNNILKKERLITTKPTEFYADGNKVFYTMGVVSTQILTVKDEDAAYDLAVILNDASVKYE